MSISVGSRAILPATHIDEVPDPKGNGFYFGIDLEVIVVGSGYQHPGKDRYWELRTAPGQDREDIGSYFRRASDLKEAIDGSQL